MIMSHWRFHWLEKMQVQLASAAAVALSYFLLWPLVRPADPQGPLLLLMGGNVSGTLVILLSTIGFAAAACLLTTHSRPEGAMIVTLFGVGGLVLRSTELRPELWQQGGDFAGMFAWMIIELIVLQVVVVLAALVVGVVRGWIASVRPRWLWRDPLEEMAEVEEDSERREEAASSEPVFLRWYELAFPIVFLVIVPMWIRRGPKKRTHADRDEQQRFWLCLAMSGFISIALIMVLMQSGDRGQILFALVASFTAGMLIAHQVYPTLHSGVAWIVPVPVAVTLYVMGSFAAGQGQTHNAWLRVPAYAQALPLDWVTAAAGGAGLGYWISARIHELRHLEKHKEVQAEGG